jgi:hypothetical protein
VIVDPMLFWIVGSVLAFFGSLWWRRRYLLTLEEERRRLLEAAALVQAQHDETMRRIEADRAAAERRRREEAEREAAKPRDVAAELAALRKWFHDPMFDVIASNIRLTRERVFVGMRKTGQRFVGVVESESQVPADSVDIRPIRDMSELVSAMPAEWAMDDDLFDVRLAQGETLVQVPIEHTPLMEDVHEPVYKEVVHTVYVLLDVSPSMFPSQGEAWRVPVWKGLTLKVLFDTIQAEATFTLRTFDSRARAPTRVVSLDQALDLGKKVVSQGEGSGTNILAAVQAAVEDFGQMTYDTADVLIITDGEDETDIATPLRKVLDEKRIRLNAVMLGQKNEALRACCDSYQVLEHGKDGVKVHPAVCRVVQPLGAAA